MAGRHALRGMVTAWLGLIVLQTVSTNGGSGRVAGLFYDIDRLLARALDPAVPAIPNLARGGRWGTGNPGSIGADPTVTSPNTPYHRTGAAPAPSPQPTRTGGIGGIYAT